MTHDFSNVRTLVIGDVMLDEYVTGTVTRISDEAPVSLLKYTHTQQQLGGAAAVANIVAGLGANVVLIGVTGADDAAPDVVRLLTTRQISTARLIKDHTRRTTVKRRYISHTHAGQQLLRVDTEDTHAISEDVSQKIGEISATLDEFDVVLIADHSKGVCTEALRPLLAAMVLDHKLPVIVDPPRHGRWEKYQGVTGMTPNTAELAAFPDDPVTCLSLRWLAHTRDSHGIDLCRPSAFDIDRTNIATTSRAVADVTGAGDTVLAVLGLCTAQGWDITDACRLANVAAGLQVERHGVARITPEELEQ